MKAKASSRLAFFLALAFNLPAAAEDASRETVPIDEPEEARPGSSEEEDDRNLEVVCDRSLMVRVNDWFTLTLGGLLQARYTVNYRTNPPTDRVTLKREKQAAQGFDAARARAKLGIGLTQFVALS